MISESTLDSGGVHLRKHFLKRDRFYVSRSASDFAGIKARDQWGRAAWMRGVRGLTTMSMTPDRDTLCP